MKRKVTLVFIVLLLGLVAAFSRPTYHYPAPAELHRKAHYLERIIRTPEGEASELTDLGNAEWALFSMSYSVYAFTNMAQLDPGFRGEAAHYTQLAIAKMLTGTIAQAFRNPDDAVEADSVTSILYLRHLNMMLSCHRLLNPASPYQALHDSLSATLHRRLAAAPNHCLPSYPEGVWVPDNTVALASLQLHSDLTGSPYRAFCQQWIAYARQHLTDSATGLLLSRPSTTPPKSPAALTWAGAFSFSTALPPPTLPNNTGSTSNTSAPILGCCGCTTSAPATTKPAKATSTAGP